MFAMEHLIWIYSSLLAALTINLVSARFCENGNHRCLPPKECCAQGCCYLFSPPSAPRPQQPADHVLNLFFINHWYFWLFLFAIVIALLLICSLWKKRHTLFCAGWSTSSNHRTPSEGDSAGSCYAPPHYSRCSSFYHAPPPYNEVTSKPDLYPLVFSYTNDGSKNGGSNGAANYLMVQYFRNYIVRPIGSLSATSTIDSLSSSFICTANEANTMVPPPYSSAASPDDLSISLQNYAIPRSASQQGYNNSTNNNNNNNFNNISSHHTNNNNNNNNNSSSHNNIGSNFNISNENQIESQLLTGNAAHMANRPMSVPNTTINSHYHFRASESANFSHLFQLNDHNDIENRNYRIPTSSNSNSTMTTTHTCSGSSRNHNISISDDDDDDEDEEIFHQASEGASIGNIGNDSVGNQASSIYHSNDTMLSLSAAMIDKIAYSKQTNDHTKLDMIQKQLEKCCELIQQQQQQIQQTRSHFNITTSFDSASESPISCEIAKKMSESAIMGLGYMNSNTGSTVSSLANLNSPSSPPQATSPTQEVKDLLEQIRQLKDRTFSDEELNINLEKECIVKLENQPRPGPSTEISYSNNTIIKPTIATTNNMIKRPTSLSNKRRFFNMKNRSVYIPISCNPLSSPNGLNTKLRSPLSGTASVFLNKSRGSNKYKNGYSKSAPTTPGTFPENCDNSPLLDEHDEDAETEADQNC